MKICTTVFAALALTSSVATAGISFTTGDALETAPPIDIAPNNTTDNDNFIVFQEQSAVASPVAIPLDQVVGGLTDQNSDLVSGMVDAGIEFNSFYIHVDSDGSSTQEFLGSIRFTNAILGVIVTSGGLNSTDILLGNPGTSYPTNASLRGLELFGNQDAFTISDDRRTFTYDGRVSTAIDGIRIITAVPSPGALALLSIGAVSCMIRRRDRLAV